MTGFTVYNMELDGVGMLNIKVTRNSCCRMFVNVTRTLQSELKGPGILVGKVMLGKRETM